MSFELPGKRIARWQYLLFAFASLPFLASATDSGFAKSDTRTDRTDAGQVAIRKSSVESTLNVPDASDGQSITYRGIEPTTNILIIREDRDRVTAMEVNNASGEPALLKSSVHDIPEVQVINRTVHVLQPVLRMSADGRARIRVLVEPLDSETNRPVQHLKRVWFESIPPKLGADSVGFNFRYDIPLLIHPKGLEWEDQPWKHLSWCRRSDGALIAENNSPYVIRLVETVVLNPTQQTANVFKGNVLLPYSHIEVELPGAVTNIESVSVTPATAWGIPVPKQWTSDVERKTCGVTQIQRSSSESSK